MKKAVEKFWTLCPLFIEIHVEVFVSRWEHSPAFPLISLKIVWGKKCFNKIHVCESFFRRATLATLDKASGRTWAIASGTQPPLLCAGARRATPAITATNAPRATNLTWTVARATPARTVTLLAVWAWLLLRANSAVARWWLLHEIALFNIGLRSFFAMRLFEDTCERCFLGGFVFKANNMFRFS